VDSQHTGTRAEFGGSAVLCWETASWLD
jgi:hypothetical protein